MIIPSRTLILKPFLPKQAGLAVIALPGPADDAAATGDHLLAELTVHVGAVGLHLVGLQA